MVPRKSKWSTLEYRTERAAKISNALCRGDDFYVSHIQVPHRLPLNRTALRIFQTLDWPASRPFAVKTSNDESYLVRRSAEGVVSLFQQLRPDHPTKNDSWTFSSLGSRLRDVVKRSGRKMCV
jgi:hypothetical protein